MDQTKLILFTENLDAGIGNFSILQNINWQILPRQHWIITGPNGSGKTVLARTIAHKCRIFKGTLHVRNQRIAMISFTDTSKLFRNPNSIHYYQQRFNAFESDGHLTVKDYLKFGGYDEKNSDHLSLLRLIGIDQLIEKERIKLSSGQTRKMFLARAILSKPQLLILDNPYIGIDAPGRIYLNNLLDQLVKDHDLTLVLSGYYAELPNSITHRIHLDNGKIRFKGFLKEVEKKVSQLTIPKSNKEVLNDLKKYYQQHVKPIDNQSIIRLEKVSVQYGATKILENLNWEVLPGEKWVIKGNNGSGKSTLISLIYGDNPQAYANRVFLFDKRRGKGQSIWEIKKLIGFTSAELHTFFADSPLACDLVFTGLFDGFSLKKMPAPEVIDFGRKLFQYFGIESYYKTPFNQLSTGTQRLLFFMRALIKVPPVLFLDEPFQGLNDVLIQKCKDLLDLLLDERHTLIFVTHFEKEIPQLVNQSLELVKP